MAKIGPKENPSVWDSKNSWNWRILLVPATIWQILNVKRRQPEVDSYSAKQKDIGI